MTLSIRYSWDIATQSFVPRYKWEYTYDANGNETFFISSKRDMATQSLVCGINGNLDTISTAHDTSWLDTVDTATQSFVPTDQDVSVYDYNFSSVRPMLSLKREEYYPDIGVFKPIFVQEYSVHTDTEINYVIEGIYKHYDTNFNTWNELEGEEFKSYWYYTKVSEFLKPRNHQHYL